MLKILIKKYILFYFYYKKITGRNLPGLGFVQKLLKKDFVFKAFGKLIYYDHKVVGSYDLLLIGKSNEPETPLLLQKVVSKLDQFNFIDVGASIGEMVMHVTCYDNLDNAIAFEPRPDCAGVIEKNIALNKESRCKIYNKAVSDKDGDDIEIFINSGGTSSGIYSEDSAGDRVLVKTITLDSVLPNYLHNPILLIDIEGAEPLAISGGKNFIENNLPLIIFEYNSTSKKHFSLEYIYKLLPEKYDIYSLKSDASLSKDFTDSWNAVALPNSTIFSEILCS